MIFRREYECPFEHAGLPANDPAWAKLYEGHPTSLHFAFAVSSPRNSPMLAGQIKEQDPVPNSRQRPRSACRAF